MDRTRRRLIEVVDAANLGLQCATQSFGVQTDGRESVVVSDAAGHAQVRLHDYADQGWPELTLPLPPNAEFLQASTGLLTRVVLFRSRSGVLEVARALQQRGLRLIERNGAFRAELDARAMVRIQPWRSRSLSSAHATLIRIRQRRTAEEFERGIRRRAARA
ncbi:hypothetical protein [Gaopeijia maritima]|uniref:Uncharacterized protein n=1 Tax=Gaopeijia maritima TaxID=3119007 RepID=A0ABU9E6D2_9BACT